MPGARLTVAITGAGGFVGSAVVRAALRQGSRVRAVLRPGKWLTYEHPDLTVHPVGLGRGRELPEALAGADIVVHCAAALTGSLTRQRTETVDATRTLLEALRTAGVARLVGISSFAVYEYGGLHEGAVLDERVPVDRHPERRTPYARAKIEQERLFVEFGATILRPGVIYGHERLWVPALGRPLGARAWLLVGPDALIPLVHVDDVADAVLCTARRQSLPDVPINLVEDALPTRRQALAVLNQSVRRRILTLPWGLHRSTARIVGRAHRAVTRGRFRLPGLLDPVQLEAGFTPLRYSNARAKDLLAWQPLRHWSGEIRPARLSLEPTTSFP